MPNQTRRTVLRLLGAGAFASLGPVGQTLASPPGKAGGDDELRLFSEAGVSGSFETVVQENYAYIATGKGMAIVDWHNPQRPEVVAEVDVAADIEENLGIMDPVIGIPDVKVDADVAALANDRSENPGGISLYDVSNPADPEFLAQYDPAANIHNCFIGLN